jgi:hypothetical protein
MSCLNNIDVVHIPSSSNMDFFDNDKGSLMIVLNINCISKPSIGFIAFPTEIYFWACMSSISYSLPPMLLIKSFNSSSSTSIIP